MAQCNINKLNLIDEDLLIRLIAIARPPVPQEPANPLLRELNHIDQSLDSTLQNKSTPAHVKEKQVGRLLNKYNTHVQSYENQKYPQSQSTTTNDSSEDN